MAATTGTSKASDERAGGKQSGAAAGRGSGGPRTATVDLPFVTATFRMPEVSLPRVRVPSQQDVKSAAKAVQPYLPSGQQAAYFAGLAALATLEMIEWPVAVAIGVGSALVQHAASGGPRQETPAKATS